MNDFFGRPLAIGDTVAFIENSYRNLKRGVITAMTAKKVRIQFAAPSWATERLDETLRFPSEIIKH